MGRIGIKSAKRRRYPRWTRANTVFRSGNRAQLRFPHGRASARLLRQPPRTRFPLPKNSGGLSSEQKSGLARKRTTVGRRPPRTMTMPSADFLPLESVSALVHRGYQCRIKKAEEQKYIIVIMKGATYHEKSN